MNYYDQIKEKIIDVETTELVKNYSINKTKLEKYYEIGKLLIDAQGGEKRAKYGDNLIKEYSMRLTKEIGDKYNITLLKRIRQFYLLLQKGAPLVHQLSWSHYMEILPIKNINKINYYINECIKYNLSKRQLRERIKSNEYERLDNKTKNKLIKNEETNVTDFIKNPIVIKNTSNYEIISEKILKNMILENIPSFLKQLGDGFSFIDSEYKIKLSNRYNYIDLLLFNYIFNCFVVVELKVTELKKDHIGQIQEYMNYINKNIKSIYQENTIGVIIAKKDNKFVIEYSSDNRIFSTTYLLK